MIGCSFCSRLCSTLNGSNDAIIRFRQGFGRLVRSATDTGRVVVLDSRIMTKNYGRMFLDALPEGVRIEVFGEDEYSA